MSAPDIKIQVTEKVTESEHVIEYSLIDRESAAVALKQIINLFDELITLYEESRSPHMVWYREYSTNILTLLKMIYGKNEHMIRYEHLLLALSELSGLREELDRPTNIDIESRVEAIANIAIENIEITRNNR